MDPVRKGTGGLGEVSQGNANNAVQKLGARSSRTVSDQAPRKINKDLTDLDMNHKPATKLHSGKAQRVLKDVTNQRSTRHAIEVAKKTSLKESSRPTAATGASQLPAVQEAAAASANLSEEVVRETANNPEETLSSSNGPQNDDNPQDPTEKGNANIPEGDGSSLDQTAEGVPSNSGLAAGSSASTGSKKGLKVSVKKRITPPRVKLLTESNREQRKVAAAMKLFGMMEKQRMQQQEMERMSQAKTLHIQQLLRKAMKGWKSVKSNALPPADQSTDVLRAEELQDDAPPSQESVNRAIKGKQKVEVMTAENCQENGQRETSKLNGSAPMFAGKKEVQSPSQACGSAAVAIVDQSIQELKGGRKKRVRTRGRQKLVERMRMVESIVALFSELKGDDLLDDLAVLFKGEEGMDAGGLTAELFTCFFLAAFEPKVGLFTSCALDLDDSRSCSERVTLLPAERGPDTDKKEWTNTFVQIGKVFIKSILDQVPLPRRLASTFFKFILDCPLDLEDLGSFDPQLKRSYESILAATSEDLDNMCLSFDNSSDAVTTKNRAQFVDQMVYQKLLGCRLEAMEALREGMLQIRPLYNQLRTLSPAALEDRMCGTEVMNGRDVAVFLHFPPGEVSQASHKEQLLALLDAWDQSTLSEFLKFTTGLCVLPIGGLKNPDASPKHMIKVVSCTCPSCKKKSAAAKSACTLLPQASTCFWTLRLPVCATAEDLGKKLLVAFKWGNGSFGQL